MASFVEDRVGGMGIGGDGLGGGLFGGLLLGALLGRGGLGGLGGGAVETPAVVANLATKDDLTLQTLGDIKASIPYNEAQVQLALSQAVASLTQQNTSNTQYLSTQNVQLATQAATNQALLTRDVAAVDTNVDRQSAAIQVAIQNSERNISDLINGNRIKDLEQQLTVSQLKEVENRAINREQVNSHNQTVTVNQAQAQQQLQNQEIRFALNSLLSGFGQLARGTNSNVIVGSTGTATGAQTANPTNVIA